MRTHWLAVVGAVSILGYAGSAMSGTRIVDADEAAVAHCTYLKDVNGRSVFGERLKGPATEKAKEDARSEAVKAGATHIVWDKPVSTDITTISGKAYRCEH